MLTRSYYYLRGHWFSKSMDLPPVADRMAPVPRRWFFLWMSIAIASSILVSIFDIRSGYHFPLGAMVFIPIWVWLLCYPFVIYRFVQLKKLAERKEGMLCTHCGYDMSAINDEARCPECGNVWDSEAARAQWARMGDAMSSVGQEKKTS